MYKYPDTDDQNLFENIIDETWGDGGLEDKYIHDCLSNMFSERKSVLLDAGCGTGRLMHAYLPFVSRLIAIDPDMVRLRKAQNEFITVSEGRVGQQIFSEFICSTIQNFRCPISIAIDIVLCSHIIQHVHTEEVPEILKNIHINLKQDGSLMLLTTNCKSGASEYLKVDTETNRHLSVSKKEFNLCVEKNDKFLPTKLFDEKELVELLEAARFKIIYIKKYHGYPKIKGDNFIFARRM